MASTDENFDLFLSNLCEGIGIIFFFQGIGLLVCLIFISNHYESLEEFGNKVILSKIIAGCLIWILNITFWVLYFSYLNDSISVKMAALIFVPYFCNIILDPMILSGLYIVVISGAGLLLIGISALVFIVCLLFGNLYHKSAINTSTQVSQESALQIVPHQAPDAERSIALPSYSPQPGSPSFPRSPLRDPQYTDSPIPLLSDSLPQDDDYSRSNNPFIQNLPNTPLNVHNLCCQICMGDIEREAAATPCRHMFHPECIKNTFEQSITPNLCCPVCSQSFTQDQLITLTHQNLISQFVSE